MSIDLRTRDHQWCLDASWSAYGRRPPAREIHARARAIGATNYIIVPGNPVMVGFFTFADGSRRKSLSPAAIAAARHLGPNAYAEYEPEPGKVWIVATGPDGLLAPFADTLISADDREAFEQRLDPAMIARRQRFDLDKVEDEFATFAPISFPLREVSSRRTMVVLGAAAAILSLGALGADAWHVHNVHVAAAERKKMMEQEAARRRLAEERRTVVAPDDWLAACMNTAKATPLFVDGWELQDWTCHEQTIDLTWTRAGGTLAQAPAGKYDDQGNVIRQVMALQPKRTRPTPAPKGDARRMLLALLQRVGVQSQLHAAPVAVSPGQPVVPSGVLASTSAIFTWPTDPRSTQWGLIPTLHFIQLHHETGLTRDFSSSNESAGSYAINVQIASGDPA